MNRRNALLAIGGAPFAAQQMLAQQKAAAPKKKFTLGVSIYTGWQPWYWLRDTGKLKAWFAKYGYEITVKEFDYGPSIDAFTGGELDAVVITSMDSFISPAKSGVECTSLILGDYSNGNDAVITRGIPTIQGLKGKMVYRVENSVSDYVLERGLQLNGMSTRDVKLSNMSDTSIEGAFRTQKDMAAIVTWNPMVLNIMESMQGVHSVFDSSKIPGEVLDLLVVRTDVLKANPNIGDAFTGAWYEAMSAMSKRGAEADAVRTVMAKTAKTNLKEYDAQLRTTYMYYDPKSALDFLTGNEIKAKTDLVRQVCARRGLYGSGVNADFVGISFPDGTVAGNPKNVKFHFDATWTKKMLAGGIR